MDDFCHFQHRYKCPIRTAPVFLNSAFAALVLTSSVNKVQVILREMRFEEVAIRNRCTTDKSSFILKPICTLLKNIVLLG